MSGTTPAHGQARPVLERLRDLGGRLARDLRPWLRREAWTAENLRATVEAARRDPSRAALWVIGVGLVVLTLAIALAADATEGLALAEVREGPFRVTVVESGALQALRSVSYASTIQSNQAKIVPLVPEGKLVQKGDLLILFDSTPFEEEIRRSQAALGQAQADLEKARQEYRLQEIENTEELAAARQKTQRSELELKDVREGKGKLAEDEASAAVANAERELQKLISAPEDLKPLLAEGFITKLELERAEHQVEKAREDLELAKRRRDALLNFGRPLELSQAESDALTTRETLKQLESAAA